MKFATLMLTAMLAMLWTGDAFAESRKHKTYRSKSYGYAYRPHHRSNTVAGNGLCQRDTGTPTSSLNFHNRCDTQEFWDRMQERGGRR